MSMMMATDVITSATGVVMPLPVTVRLSKAWAKAEWSGGWLGGIRAKLTRHCWARAGVLTLEVNGGALIRSSFVRPVESELHVEVCSLVEILFLACLGCRDA